jgi:hypothetical protein
LSKNEDEVGDEEEGGVRESRDRRAEQSIARRIGSDEVLLVDACEMSIRIDGVEPFRPELGMGTVDADT